ncbi:hypothetical protein L7D48_21810, partial [Streptomyces sp. S1A]|uniref:hypothetical protein n=1 Tax=Streptomyces sp. ICN903 TaxID=2964654 RepID=UPI001EDC30E1
MNDGRPRVHSVPRRQPGKSLGAGLRAFAGAVLRTAAPVVPVTRAVTRAVASAGVTVPTAGAAAPLRRGGLGGRGR